MSDELLEYSTKRTNPTAMEAESSERPAKTGGLNRLSTIFLVVLGLHVVVIVGISAYHLLRGNPESGMTAMPETMPAAQVETAKAPEVAAAPVAEVVDVLQIPAFLSRQTDLLLAAAALAGPLLGTALPQAAALLTGRTARAARLMPGCCIMLVCSPLASSPSVLLASPQCKLSSSRSKLFRTPIFPRRLPTSSGVRPLAPIVCSRGGAGFYRELCCCCAALPVWPLQEPRRQQPVANAVNGVPPVRLFGLLQPCVWWLAR